MLKSNLPIFWVVFFSIVVAFISYLAVAPYPDLIEAFAAAVTLMIIATAFSSLIGLVSILIKPESFRVVFLWSYIFIMPIVIVFFILGSID